MRAFYNQYIFPHILDRVMQIDSMSEARTRLLAPISGHVVEVGFGTGLNVAYYGAGVKSLTTVDPNQGVGRLAEHRMDQAAFPIQHKLLSAEKLPFDDASVDTLVSTWTLCSIPDVAQALQEIRRVLKPDGVFHFVEHARSPDAQIAKWQTRLTPIQKVVADGCHLDRDMFALVKAAGFELIEQQTFEAQGVPSIGRFMVMGRATPRG